MPIRVYTLYSAAAAAANLANVQMLANCEVLAINYGISSAAAQGQAVELSTVGARQYATNNITGILGIVLYRADTGAVNLFANGTIMLPPGIKLNRGDFIYMHGTQLGSGGTTTNNIQVYVRES